MIYVANFKIIADEGALGLGLTSTEFGEEFTFAGISTENAEDKYIYTPVLDFTAISGLTVGGKAVGPAMPEDAPFTAITTDAGPVISIKEQGTVGGVP